MSYQQQRNMDVKQTGESVNGDSSATPICVEIFVSRGCFVCQYAYEIAELIERDFPDVDLHIIDIHNAEKPIPEPVFATPTYLLNGRLWSLGNPSPEDAAKRLSELLPSNMHTANGHAV